LDDDVLDSTGMIGFRNRRVLDRDGDQPAGGRRLVPEYVFGASGAAAVYRRAMLEDVAFEGEMFDEDFFTYREDVDLAWRAQHLGWKTMYVPSAVARHRRRVAPGRRRQLPSEINRRSVANRWRMILKNETAIGCRADGLAILARDLLTLGYCTLRERQTLGAIADVLVSTPRIQSWRNDIMRRRRAPAEETLAWFGRQASLPLIEANGDRIHS
jgi:GT2 family glycosyltransferase